MKTLIWCFAILGLIILLNSQSLNADSNTPPMPRQRYLYYFPFMPYQPITTSTPTPTPARKIGIGSPYNTCTTIEKLNVTWWYGWNDYPPDCAHTQDFAMIWGIQTLQELSPYVTHLLGGNECDLAEQCNTTPPVYAPFWHAIEVAYSQVKLISPAPSPWGRVWLERLRNVYIATYGVAPRFDGGLAAHCYFATAAQCITELQEYIKLAKLWNAPGVWLTEFAFLPCEKTTTGLLGAGNQTNALAEARKLQAWLEAEPMILGYAWFADTIRDTEWWAFKPAACNTSLIDNQGLFTPFGLWYTER